MNLSQLFSDYFQTSERIDTRLRMLGVRLCIQSDIKAQIIKRTSLKCRPFHKFKILMLLHHCFLQNLLTPNAILSVLDGLQTEPSKDVFEAMVDQKINGPYQLYLQKRILADQTNFMDTYQKIYQYLNLLSRGGNLSDFLYTFGRYYHEKYEFAIDFNILLGKDFNKIYSLLCRKLRRINYDEDLILELEKIHEKLYIVYFNCYYYKYMRKYVPKWFNTENRRPALQDKTKELENKSMVSISTNSNSPCSGYCVDTDESMKKMSQSTLIESSFQGKNISEFELSQLGLLKSMERVLQEMDQF